MANTTKVKCQFCAKKSGYHSHMFNGRAVCWSCAIGKKLSSQLLAATKPMWRGRPESYTREEALRRLWEVKVEQIQRMPGIRVTKVHAFTMKGAA